MLKFHSKYSLQEYTDPARRNSFKAIFILFESWDKCLMFSGILLKILIPQQYTPFVLLSDLLLVDVSQSLV